MIYQRDFCLFACKTHSFHLKSYIETPVFYTYTEDELVYLGGGSSYISSLTFDRDTVSPVKLVQQVIDKVCSCNGHVNVFDLNLLRDIKI